MATSMFATRFPLNLALVAAAGLLAVGCAGATDASESPAPETLDTSTAEIVSTLLRGKVTASSSPNPLLGRKQTFGSGEYRASRGELAGVGDNATRVVEVGPAMEAIACADETPGQYCPSFRNLGGTNRSFDVTAGTSLLKVRSLVVAYRDPAFGGVADGFEIGRYDNAGSFFQIGNDTISSLRVAPGLTARLCSDDPETTTGGTCMTFTGDVSQIPAPLDNNGSWLEVRPATTLYRDPGLGGVSQQLGAGRFPVQALSVVGNDTVSSVLVNEGVSSRLCSDDPNTTVGGTCDTFTKSALGLNASLNDTTSWVENRHTVILAPLNEQSFFGPVILRGYAASPTDGELAGAQLRWYSSVDGFLGTGKALTVHLTEATACERGIRHAITLVATDSKGVVFATTRWMFSSLIC